MIYALICQVFPQRFSPKSQQQVTRGSPSASSFSNGWRTRSTSDIAASFNHCLAQKSTFRILSTSIAQASTQKLSNAKQKGPLDQKGQDSGLFWWRFYLYPPSCRCVIAFQPGGFNSSAGRPKFGVARRDAHVNCWFARSTTRHFGSISDQLADHTTQWYTTISQWSYFGQEWHLVKSNRCPDTIMLIVITLPAALWEKRSHFWGESLWTLLTFSINRQAMHFESIQVIHVAPGNLETKLTHRPKCYLAPFRLFVEQAGVLGRFKIHDHQPPRGPDEAVWYVSREEV